MSTITAKERNMLMITMVLVLYAAAFLFYRKQSENWKKHMRIYQGAREKYVSECALIAAKDEWDARYREMCTLMPVFPYDKDVDTHWLNVMDTVATGQKLSITRRQTGKEEEVGDVYELPIDCKNWEGTLESLVNFLYGLRQQGAMLDVRQLYIRPDSKKGYLKGTFALYCAYMRGDVVEVGGQSSEAGDQSSDAGAQSSEAGGQRPEVGAPSSEAGGQESDPGETVSVEPGSELRDTEGDIQPKPRFSPSRSSVDARSSRPRGGAAKSSGDPVDEAEAVRAALEALKAAGQ